jgi:hypothetical protein
VIDKACKHRRFHQPHSTTALNIYSRESIACQREQGKAASHTGGLRRKIKPLPASTSLCMRMLASRSSKQAACHDTSEEADAPAERLNQRVKLTICPFESSRQTHANLHTYSRINTREGRRWTYRYSARVAAQVQLIKCFISPLCACCMSLWLCSQ